MWNLRILRFCEYREPWLFKDCTQRHWSLSVRRNLKILRILRILGNRGAQGAKDQFDTEPWSLKTYIKPMLPAGMVDSWEYQDSEDCGEGLGG